MQAMTAVAHASRSEHRQSVRSAPLTVRIERRIVAETEVDVVGFFADLDPEGQAAYHALDLSEGGFADYERPMVYLTTTLEVDIWGPEGHRFLSTIDDGDVQDRISYRSGTIATGQQIWWLPADYDALLDAVPWMRPQPAAAADEHGDPAALARIPGPLDSPLF